MSQIKPKLSKESGVTLVEYLVGMGIGAMVLLVLILLSLYGGRSFAAMANYVELNAASLRVLDQLTRELRQGQQLTAFQTNSITLDNGTNNNAVTFTYSSADRTL